MRNDSQGVLQDKRGRYEPLPYFFGCWFHDGVEYDEAIDVESAPYTYTESTNRVEVPEAP